MLVVAQFNYPEGATNIAGQAELAQAIRAEAQKARLTHLRVEAATAALHADDRAGAEQLGARYNASLVVWGDVAGERTSVSFLNRRGIPPLTAQDVPINQLARREIADPPNYSRYAMDDFPDQLSFLALLAVGQSLAIDQNYDAAIQAIGQAVISGAPGKPIGGIDDAYFRLGWLQQAAKNNPFQARPVYGQALALAPNAAIYNDRGVARWLLRDLKGALEDLDQAITLDPRYALAYTNQGAVRFAQGDLKGALADYDQAIALDPNDADAYTRRGIDRSAQNDLEGALADYDQAIALDPKFAFAYVNRGLDRKSQGDLDGARADLDQAIALDPRFAFAYHGRGIIRSAQGDLTGAITDYSQAIALDPRYDGAYFNRGLAYQQQGDAPHAIADFQQAARLTQDAKLRS